MPLVSIHTNSMEVTCHCEQGASAHACDADLGPGGRRAPSRWHPRDLPPRRCLSSRHGIMVPPLLGRLMSIKALTPHIMQRYSAAAMRSSHSHT